MGVAAAIVGGAVIGAVGSNAAAKKSGSAASKGARLSANAQVQATQLQIQETRRQFDEQMKLLAPLIQNQYGAQSAFSQLLGIGDYDPETGEFGGGGIEQFRGEGGFRDPNLSPQQLASADPTQSARGRQAFQNVLAPTDPAQDLAIQRADQNRLAAPSPQEDPFFQFTRDTAVVGPEFETSPGYEFAVEQAQREVERRQSAGGGFGGRALLEAQRRAIGEANKEYYNYVGARQRDLGRQDIAFQDARRREELDLARGDAALENYFGRRAGDLTRQDQAVAANEAAREFDIRRGDQSYYNYLNAISGAGGFGNAVGQGVQASGAAGTAIANAYGAQGRGLASVYQRQGENLASIESQRIAGINNAIQSGISNYLTYAGTQ